MRKKQSKTYDVNKLYSKKWLDLKEVSFLMGGIKPNNLYQKFSAGVLPYELRENKRGEQAKRVDSQRLFEYIVKRRQALLDSAERLQLPSEDINWGKRAE
jgi:hypothetical protein